MFHKKVSCHVLVIKASEIYSKEYFSHFTVVGLPNCFFTLISKIISRHERFGDFPQLLCVLKRDIFCMLCSSQHFYLDYLVTLEGELYQESNKPMHQCKKGTGRCKEEVSLFLASSSPSFTFSMELIIMKSSWQLLGYLMDYTPDLPRKGDNKWLV